MPKTKTKKTEQKPEDTKRSLLPTLTKSSYQRLNAAKFGLSLGLISAIALFLLAIIATTGYGQEWVDLIAKVYLGYSANLLGALLGAIFAFIDCFIFGWLWALIYNRLI